MGKKLGLLVWVWFMLCGFCVGRFVVEKNNLKVTSPSSLSGVHECAMCLCFDVDFSAFFFFLFFFTGFDGHGGVVVVQ